MIKNKVVLAVLLSVLLTGSASASDSTTDDREIFERSLWHVETALKERGVVFDRVEEWSDVIRVFAVAEDGSTHFEFYDPDYYQKVDR